MRGGTLFSGVGVPELAMPWVDWRFCAEIDKAASAVHAARFPSIPNLGDVTKVDWNAIEPVDLLVAGSPCQSFSVAGKRLGLDDPRGNLALFTLGVARQLRVQWLVFENVPGLLSSDGGRDFGAFLGLLGECGHGYAWRVLDAQHFGVPQRRRRVFVVGCLGDWRRAAAVLFERESLSGNPPPRREAREGVAIGALAGTSPGGGWRVGADEAAAGQLIAETLRGHPRPGSNSTGAITVADVARCDTARQTRLDAESETFVAHTLRGDGFDASEDGTGRGVPLVPVVLPFDTTQITSAANRSNPQPGDPCHPLARAAHPPAISVFLRGRDGGGSAELTEGAAPTLRASQGGGDKPHVMAASAVRRLTPLECERLQGMPDGHTLVTYRGKPMADGPRYKMIGNSMAVPVLRWIGDRIRRAA